MDNSSSTQDFSIKKKVDESWKDNVSQEKEAPLVETEENALPEINYQFFLSSIAMQAVAAMGDIPNPATGQKSQDLIQAKYLIDTIQMIEDKTKGNLTPEEAAMTKEFLYELKLKFVQKSQTITT